MPKPTRQANATSIRMRLCRALAGSSMHRKALAAVLSDLDTKQLTQNVFMATRDKLVEYYTFDGGLRMYRLTTKGRRYVEGAGAADGDNAPAPAAKKARPAKVPAKRAKPGAKMRRRPAETAEIAAPATHLAVREFEPVVERSFRCAVFSDGAFHLAKNGQTIDLTAAEHAEMLRYIERMAVEAA